MQHGYLQLTGKECEIEFVFFFVDFAWRYELKWTSISFLSPFSDPWLNLWHSEILPLSKGYLFPALAPSIFFKSYLAPYKQTTGSLFMGAWMSIRGLTIVMTPGGKKSSLWVPISQLDYEQRNFLFSDQALYGGSSKFPSKLDLRFGI